MQNTSFNRVRYNQLQTILMQSRFAYRQAMRAHSLHPAVLDLSQDNNPLNWHQLVMELPHYASDGVSIAYYRKESDIGERATVTKLGKYLTRHFPMVKPNTIRDIVSKYNTNGSIITSLDKIIELMESADSEDSTFPTSCMTKQFKQPHPYHVYNPKFGWGLAIKKNDSGEIIGRALVLDNGDSKCFVRAFTKSIHSNSGFTIDPQLETWLQYQGFEYLRGWPKSAKFDKIEYRGEIVAPYIDGSNDYFVDHGDYFTVTSDSDCADYKCNSTNGFAESVCKETCERCGDRVDPDDTTYIENYGCVCQHCLDNHFVYVESRRIGTRWIGGEYYLGRDVIQTDNGDYYPSDSYSDFDIVELQNGDYTHIDNAVLDIDSEEYYHIDDIGTELFYCEDDNEYHSENYWQCAESGTYYSNDTEWTELENGDKIHPNELKNKHTINLFQK